MLKPKISIINESQALTDADIEKVIPALQRQVSEHFAPTWGLDAQLKFVAKGQSPDLGSWWMVILDDSDQAGRLGYHDLTPEGMPIGKAFAKADLDNHLSWTVTISHEILEMMVDPELNLTTFVQDGPMTGKLYAYEVCDPVEDDQYGYAIDGVMVSNFVLPTYFEPTTHSVGGSALYDHCGHLSGPAPMLLSGGFLGEFDVGRGQGWTQLTAPTEGQPHRGHIRIPMAGSRSDRRRRPHPTWKRSEPRLVPM